MTIQYDQSHTKSYRIWAPKASDKSGYAPVMPSLNNQTTAAGGTLI
ncbi:hypothetical protein KKI90_14735 [Xenorhabdus bovienii]|uniref:Uncharacterized protein n=1 Tax=Xenorhabdus bovienii TaxID=40576 RepID=A0AAJ1MX03_XENBV|nr:hypothetical protein [Xenorhabdus bovienii]MDE1476814.1 hypothetical protein [Xenorhabdus bovienii]MDE1487588.1 hypothetical protein [Xenorhabdus bovienii]MDE9478465.1 hypothetical protein [Xenorhabdus bovienii]MDE9508565.1 hypothetical protein [Xenorhabdus bovienii]MDE9520200.1 hypothetical protein [Xenorhabdus bovienii]